MPLRDHFHSPLDDFTSWEGFHGGWPMTIVQQLGKQLPSRYVAEPRVHIGSVVEVDVATFDGDDDESDSAPALATNGGVATAVWAPPLPTLAVETDAPDSSAYEVLVYDLKRHRRLVAAIEIVSPANKDRPEHRRRFVAKCAALMEKQVSVTIVDLVTIRECNLYVELLELLEQSDSILGTESPLYAVSCRWRPTGEKHLLETWNRPLTLGQPLPTVPLWLTDTFAVPLELDDNYEQTCRDLRIP